MPPLIYWYKEGGDIMFTGNIDPEKFALAVVAASKQSGSNEEIVHNSLELYKQAFTQAKELNESKNSLSSNDASIKGRRSNRQTGF